VVENLVVSFVVMLAILEFFEISWQKGNTLKELLAYNYIIYRHGNIYYFFKHVAFIFTIFIVIYTNMLNIYTVTLIFMKFMDIGFKLYVIGQINEEGELYIVNLFNKQDFPISSTIRYANVAVYPIMLYLGLTLS
jgi:hypothetical protein